MLIDGQYIKYISLNTNTWAFERKNNQPFDYNNFNHFVELINLGNKPKNDFYYYPSRSNTLQNSKAIYLGNVENIENIIKSKLYTGNINDLKKVYFDSFSNFSRCKLSINTEIKRTIKVDNSDAIIIPDKLNIQNYTSPLYFGDDLDTTIILYSEQINTYFIIDYYPVTISDSSIRIPLFNHIKKYANPGTIKEQEWISALINSGILPKDCRQIYNGTIILLNSSQYTFINNLTNYYDNIITDSTLNDYILKKLDKLSPENIQSINLMLASQDVNDVSLGLKILNNYNIIENAGAIMILLVGNRSNIYNTKLPTLKAFKDILASFKLDPQQFHNYSMYSLLGHAYKMSSNEEDKNEIKKLAKEQLNNKIKLSIDSIILRDFDNFDFNVNFTIE